MITTILLSLDRDAKSKDKRVLVPNYFVIFNFLASLQHHTQFPSILSLFPK